MMLMDGRWHLANCNPNDNGLAHVPGVVPLCGAQPQARAVSSIKTLEGTALVTDEFWNAALKTLITTGKVSSVSSANTFGLVVDVEELVRDCAGGKDSERCQRGAFLYIRDDKTLLSIHDLRDEDMHRIHVRGEKNSGKVSMAACSLRPSSQARTQ